jgi:hypothetical protein
MTLRSEKRLQNKQHHNIYSKRGMNEPPQAMTEGEARLASFLLLKLDIRAPYYYIIYGNEGEAFVDLWLILNKCGKIMTRGLDTRKGQLWFRLAESSGCILCQSCYDSC